MQTLAQLQSGELNGATRVKIAEGLTVFPIELYALADSLEILDLSDNQLTTLPNDFNRLHKLKIFFASNNPFDHLPEVLGHCPSLEMIGFKANQIATISEKALSKNIRWLILTDNKLTCLPQSIGELSNLQKLMLAGNQLQAQPESMAQCTNLQLVRLAANQLTYLPDWLLSLPKLSWLAFSGNPLCELTKTGQPNRPHSPLAKVSLEDFVLGDLLGQGASGLIYKATMHDNAVTEEIFNSEVAVKLFKGEVTSDGDPQDELKACITAGFHPNLVSIMAEVDGVNEQNISQKGLVMNLIPNHFFNLGQPPTLESCTRDHFDSKLSLSLKHLVKILLKVTDALQHLHEKQLCHGDLYAHNILIDHDASVLLSDFGAASHFSHLARHQQSALQAIEQRALGHLLEDLLKVCNDASSAPRVFEELRKTHLQLIGSNSPNEPKLTLSEFKFQLLDILASLELLE